MKEKNKIFRYIFLSSFNKYMFTFILLLLLSVSFIGIHYIDDNVPIAERLDHDNYIEILDVYEPRAKYIEATLGREAYEANNFDHFSVDELVVLANKDFIQTVYVVDESYINGIQDNENAGELDIISIPNIVTSSPGYRGAYPGTEDFLIQGRLPKDDKFEAVVSYEQMHNFWNFQGDINAIIGSEIMIENITYEVVGITNLPVTTISYQNNQKSDYGFIELHDEAIEFLQHSLMNMSSQGYAEEDLYFRNIFIIYDDNYTAELMDYLIEFAPSYQYSSNYVNGVIMMNHYWDEFPIIFILSSLLAGIVGVFMIVVGKKSFGLVYNFIRDMDNQHFNPSKNTFLLYMVLLVDVLIILPIILAWASWYLRSSIAILMMSPFIIVSVLSVLLAIRILKNKIEHMDL